jgi:membrane associated rhomboid family serine protease
MKLQHNEKNVPVSIFISVFIIVIFSLYSTSVIKIIPCNKNMIPAFCSNFVHIEPEHLILNLYALYSLSRVEIMIGSKQFAILIIFLLFVNTLFESILHKLYPSLQCSIGFSGILFGIMTWELITNKGFDLYIATSIIAMVLIPSITNKKASLEGHIIGAISGIIGGFVWSTL